MKHAGRMNKAKMAVVTGASSGIGRAAALELAARGTSLTLAARGKVGLEQCAEECRSRGASVTTVPTDVAVPQEIERLCIQALNTFGRFDVWVNAAGVAAFGRFLDIPVECAARVMQTNFMGAVCGSRAALQLFQQQRRGVLINVSSILGKEAIPYVAPYVASKQAIIELSSSLRQEFGQKEISICTIPAAIDAPIWQHGANYTGRRIRPIWPVYPSEIVALAIADCTEKPRRLICVGRAGKLITAAHAMLPSVYERLGPPITQAMLLQSSPAEPDNGNLAYSKRTRIHTWRMRPYAHTVQLLVLGAGGGSCGIGHKSASGQALTTRQRLNHRKRRS